MGEAATVSGGEKVIRGTGILACELFAAVTLVLCLRGGQLEQILVAGGTLLLILVPEILERLLRCRIILPLYLFCLFYAVGPMLGICHKLYYLLSWWDKMLHIFGGIAFAIFGLYLFQAFAGFGRKKLFFTALFAVCFSVAVSAVWEFAEFGADQFLGMDMQSDWVIDSIRSYSIGEGVGVAGTIEHIHSVVINGEILPISGYLDIGLMDTMLDMLLESLGAAAVAALYLIDKGRHPLVIPNRTK